MWEAIECPSLVVRGAQSDGLPAHIADDMLRLQPRSRQVTIPAVAHAIPMHKPRELAAAITTFFDACGQWTERHRPWLTLQSFALSPSYSGGHMACHAVAASYACPTRHRSASSNGLPVSISPIGRFPFPKPQGTDMLGCPVWFQGAVNEL